MKCGVCGRTLKSEKSIAAGVGPECGKKARRRGQKVFGMRVRNGHVTEARLILNDEQAEIITTGEDSATVV